MEIVVNPISATFPIAAIIPNHFDNITCERISRAQIPSSRMYNQNAKSSRNQKHTQPWRHRIWSEHPCIMSLVIFICFCLSIIDVYTVRYIKYIEEETQSKAKVDDCILSTKRTGMVAVEMNQWIHMNKLYVYEYLADNLGINRSDAKALQLDEFFTFEYFTDDKLESLLAAIDNQKRIQTGLSATASGNDATTNTNTNEFSKYSVDQSIQVLKLKMMVIFDRIEHQGSKLNNL